MGRVPWLGGLLLLWAASLAAQSSDAHFRARLLYNDRQFEAAIVAADEARSAGVLVDAADLVAARAYLERFRESADAADLTSARERLRRIDPGRLDPAQRVELVVGFGEALYFEESGGAAADVFESVLARRDGPGADGRERLLDWWASAVDREARPRPDIERQAVYQKVRDRMRDEIAANPTSAVALYWLAAAARAQGDLQGAWDAALAGWVRAPLTIDRGAALRGDLDRLVERAIVPERARATAQPPEVVRAEWEQFKEKWEK